MNMISTWSNQYYRNLFC